MIKVKLNTDMVGGFGVRYAGEIVELPDNHAQRLLATGAADVHPMPGTVRTSALEPETPAKPKTPPKRKR